MELIELCKLGIDALRQKREAGQLTVKTLWVAALGAKRWREAIATGDVADEADQCGRMAVCAGCMSRTSIPTTLPGVDAHWCGPALEEHDDAALPTCGCLVGLTIKGVPSTAGKLAVASAECSQGKWRAVPRAVPA